VPKITFQLPPQMAPSGLKLGLCLALLGANNNISQQPAWAKPARNAAVQADLIITNAKIYTIDDSFSRVDWGWKHQYNLDAMTEDMLQHIREKLS